MATVLGFLRRLRRRGRRTPTPPPEIAAPTPPTAAPARATATEVDPVSLPAPVLPARRTTVVSLVFSDGAVVALPPDDPRVRPFQAALEVLVTR